MSPDAWAAVAVVVAAGLAAVASVMAATISSKTRKSNSIDHGEVKDLLEWMQRSQVHLEDGQKTLAAKVDENQRRNGERFERLQDSVGEVNSTMVRHLERHIGQGESGE